MGAVETFRSFGVPVIAGPRVQHNLSVASLGPRSVETDHESIGVVRITKQPDREFGCLDLKEVLDKLPRPYRFVTSVQRIGEARAKVLLERKLKQLEGAKDTSSEVQRSETKNAMEESFRSGAQLYEIEMILTLTRGEAVQLNRARSAGISLGQGLKTSQATLSLFSDAQIETFGCLPSFAASLSGNRQHVTLLESENAVVGLLPIWGCRFSGLTEARRSLSLLREDQSLFHFDLFDRSHNAFNSIIIGPSGKGKSVLAGLLTGALLGDENVHVIKIDVGGSHAKECELYKGESFQLSLDKPSGLNPLSVLAQHNASDADKLAIVSKFLSVLIMEAEEGVLTKDMRAQVESSVRCYIDSKPTDPSLDDFYNQAKDFPRKQLLKRWVKGGIYQSCFAAAAGSVGGTAGPETESARLRYFNFQNIFAAGDPEFAIAGFAALMAEVNTQVLASDGRCIVLFLEEVPFFIKHCFDLIKFTTANFRKYGHAVITVSQLLTDLIVNDDRGIIENSPQRFLFAVDGSTEHFKEVLGLTDEQVERVDSLQSVQGVRSEVALQTEEGVRKLMLELSRREYWERTSSKLDKEELEELRRFLPNLTLDQAIHVLTLK
ncbi:VirB4 family type IV secretion system protein [Bdellovibrio sp. HCB290]|uniref:VirB4 family type IV secretion system protein n=1 Tax=Bdellovibrio sp. HCB290 TaxID=3394356 RepID=UPI0039B60B87